MRPHISNTGGQHRAPQGVSTFDGETPAERAERLRREHRRLDAETGERYKPRFDIDGAPNAEPQVDAGWLAAFEAELNRVIRAGEFDVPF